MVPRVRETGVGKDGEQFIHMVDRCILMSMKFQLSVGFPGIMEPFIKLPQYPFPICKECGFACIANEVFAHLKRHHGTMKASTRKQIDQVIRDIHGIIKTQEQLRQYPLPVAAVDPVPFIAAPKDDGLKCTYCIFICRTTNMRRHQREKHGLISDMPRGGNVKREANRPRALPWTAGVYCQRFSPHEPVVIGSRSGADPR